MRAQDTVRLVALAAIWGASFIFFRVLVPILGPVATATARVLIAGATLLLYCRATGYDTQWRRFWREYLVLGIVNSALPFVLYAFAALYIPASYSAILNSVAPLFGALLSLVFLGEPLTPGKLAGLVAGVSGVALVSNAGPVAAEHSFHAAVAACLVAALCYAAAGIYVKRRAAGAEPLAIAAWSQFFAGIVLLPLVPLVATDRRGHGNGHRQCACARLAVQCRRVSALLPIDCRRGSVARAHGDLPDPGVRDAVGRALSRRGDHAADARRLRADPGRHRRGAASDRLTLLPARNEREQFVGALVRDVPAHQDVGRQHLLAVVGAVPFGVARNDGAVEVDAAVDALGTAERDEVGDDVGLPLRRPPGPPRCSRRPPILKVLASSELKPLSVITSEIISDTGMPAWKPTLAVASV